MCYQALLLTRCSCFRRVASNMLEGAHDVMNSAPCMAWAVRVGVKCKEKVRVPAFHRVSLFYSTVARRLAAAPDLSVSEYFGDPKLLTTLQLTSSYNISNSQLLCGSLNKSHERIFGNSVRYGMPFPGPWSICCAALC